MAAFAVNAQEPTKKKDSTATAPVSGTQEKSISEKGISGGKNKTQSGSHKEANTTDKKDEKKPVTKPE